MKHNICALILGLGFSLTGLAAQSPKAGDMATYKQTVTESGKSETRPLSQELVSQNQDGSFEARWVYGEGQEQVIDQGTVLAEGLIYIQDLQVFCDQQKEAGADTVIETIKVAAGEFLSCRIDFQEEGNHYLAWYSAQVPFGMVQENFTTADGIIIARELESYRW